MANKEYLMTTNNFKKPTELSGYDATSLSLLRLLILKPGLNPLFPEMGVGIGNTQRYIMDDDLDDLKNRISEQIKTYLPELQDADVHCYTGVDQYLVVDVTVDGTTFRYDSSGKDNTVKLDELLNQNTEDETDEDDDEYDD